jgi:hypothetical protein
LRLITKSNRYSVSDNDAVKLRMDIDSRVQAMRDLEEFQKMRDFDHIMAVPEHVQVLEKEYVSSGADSRKRGGDVIMPRIEAIMDRAKEIFGDEYSLDNNTLPINFLVIWERCPFAEGTQWMWRNKNKDMWQRLRLVNRISYENLSIDHTLVATRMRPFKDPESGLWDDLKLLLEGRRTEKQGNKDHQLKLREEKQLKRIEAYSSSLQELDKREETYMKRKWLFPFPSIWLSFSPKGPSAYTVQERRRRSGESTTIRSPSTKSCTPPSL